MPASTAAGLLFGSLLVTLLTETLSDADMQSYGWRLPFLLAAPLGLVGRYIRLSLEDTPPQFQALAASEEASESAPLRDLLSKHGRSVIIALGATCLNAVGFYIILSYMPTYLITETGLDESEAFIATTTALAAYIGLIFLMGLLSDLLGRRTMLIGASVLFAALTLPMFSALGHASFAGIIGIQILFGTLLAMNDGTLATFLSELFPTRDRYTGFAFSFNTANALFGGTAPFIATWLINASGWQAAPSWYLVAAALVAMVAMLASTETVGRKLRE